MQSPEDVARVVSVAVGLPTPVRIGHRTIWTSIVKRPVAGPVRVDLTNLAGDQQADAMHHGGPWKALYAYPYEHYAYWQMRLGRELAPAAFGENLTIAGLTEAEVVIGQQLRIGTAVLKVSQPRIPCFKLAWRLAQDPQRFPKEFLATTRVGFYLRVIRAGELASGHPVETLVAPEGSLTVAELTRWVVQGFESTDEDQAFAQAILRLPGLAPEFRRLVEKRLNRCR